MLVNFADESKWVSIFDSFFVGVANNAIPTIVVPNSLAFRFLRVAANNQNARSTWRLGSYVYLMVDQPNPQVEVQQLIAPVNVPAVFSVPEFLSTYRLTVKPPVYFDELSLQIDGYINAQTP